MGIGQKLDAFYTKCHYEYFGFAGVAILGICTYIAIVTFTGNRSEPYSIFNHYVSELGTITPPMGWVFNLGLIIGVPAVLIFMEGTRSILKSRIAHTGRIFGIMTGIGGFFVGVFPGNIATIVPHAIAAAVFFLGGGLAISLLSLALLKQADTRMSKIVGYAGLIVLGIFIAFPIIAVMTTGGVTSFEKIIAYVTSDRPIFAADAFFEWLTLLSVVAWTFLAAIEAMTRHRYKQ